MGVNSSTASSLPCLPRLLGHQGLLVDFLRDNSKPQEPSASSSSLSKQKVLSRTPQARFGGPADECVECSLRTEELAKSAGGRLLCRDCIRADDEAKLEPLSAEERHGLDLVSGILESVSWKYWKPGSQPALICNEWLFLGDLAEATDLELLERLGISAVLNLIGWWELSSFLPEDVTLAGVFGQRQIRYHEADSEDRLFFDIISLSWPSAEKFLDTCKFEGRRVLVNCQAGHNRSACIVVCWLLVREGFTLLEAIKHVQRQRGTVLSNHGFRLQLVRLALKLGRLGELCTDGTKYGIGRTPRRSVTTGEGPQLGKIINRKRLSFKYDHNSQVAEATTGPSLKLVPKSRPAKIDRKRSLISEEVSGLISQRKLSLELLACLVHWNKNFLDDYEYTANPPVVVGTGFSGDVVLCQRQGTKDLGRIPETYLRCVKRFNHRKMVPDHIEKLKNEAVIYLSLEHPHIARLFDVYEDEEELSLVMQYCGGGTLQDVLRDHGPFSEDEFRKAAVQMLRVVSYIHRSGIVHRDIKPRNWVYEAKREVLKLIDFGFSAKRFLIGGHLRSPDPSPSTATSLMGCMGTLGYLAPEVVNSSTSEEVYTEKCDIWSLGVVFLELLSGEPVFERGRGTCDGYTEEVILRDIQDVSPEDLSRLLLRIPPASRKFLGRLLVRDPSMRAAAHELLQDPYLFEARCRLLPFRSAALDVTEVLARFRAYGEASRPTRASMLAMARAPTRLQWPEFCKLRATFDLFDAHKLTGTVDLEAFLAVVSPSDGFPASHSQREEARAIWQAICGEEDWLSYCEFLAALIPMIDDAFEDVGKEPKAEDRSPSSSGFVKVLPAYQRQWDLSKPISDFYPWLAQHRDVEDMLFHEDMAVRDVVKAMSARHFRWVVIQFKTGHHEFFDYMDLCHQIVSSATDCHNQLAAAVARIGSMSVGAVANCSGYSSFQPISDSTSFQEILEWLAGRQRSGVHRVPLMNSEGKLRRVFSGLDFLELATRFETPSAILKSGDARTFDRRSAILDLCVPNDETVLHALRLMDSQQLTICPATPRGLSGDLGGAVAMGVMAVADLKWVMETGQFEMLDRSINDFISWRNQLIAIDIAKMVRKKRLDRFNVVSVDRNESLQVLASRLLASKLQRIFLSSDEIARIVGIVSSRDILIEVLDQLIQANSFSTRVDSSAPRRQISGQ